MQVDGLVAPVGVEDGSPYLVRALMLGPAEAQGRADPHVEVAEVLQRVYQLFRVELGPGAFQALGQQSTGFSVVDRSGNLIDAPAESLVRTADGSLVAGTDFGVYTSPNNGRSWLRLGSNLPNVVIDQLSLTPTGQVLAATHGRGVWTIPAP